MDRIKFWVTVTCVFLGIVVLSVSGYSVYRLIKNYLAMSDRKIEVLAENIAMARVQENNALLKRRISESDDRVRALVKDRDMQINQMGSAVADLKQVVDRWIASDHRYQKGNEHDHEFVKIYQTDAEGGEYPIAWAMYYPNRTGDARWKTGTYPIDINSRIVLADGEDEKSAVVNIWAENNQMKETKGKKYPLKVQDVEWVRREIRDKKFAFNARLGLGVAADMAGAYPTLDMSLFSYGRTSRDLDWRFLSLGVGLSDSPTVDLAPIEYNTGNFLPLVENLFIGPVVNMDAYGQYDFGLKTSVLF